MIEYIERHAVDTEERTLNHSASIILVSRPYRSWGSVNRQDE
jgi:hypothetical protein